VPAPVVAATLHVDQPFKNAYMLVIAPQPPQQQCYPSHMLVFTLQNQDAS
jgi:hypothetical protein